LNKFAITYHPKGENSMAVSVFGCKNPSVGHVIISPTLSAGGPIKESYGLHAVFKSDLLARTGYHCLSILITNVVRATESNLVCSLEQEYLYV